MCDTAPRLGTIASNSTATPTEEAPGLPGAPFRSRVSDGLLRVLQDLVRPCAGVLDGLLRRGLAGHDRDVHVRDDVTDVLLAADVRLGDRRADRVVGLLALRVL